jgi:hypothetical protein
MIDDHHDKYNNEYFLYDRMIVSRKKTIMRSPSRAETRNSTFHGFEPGMCEEEDVTGQTFYCWHET